MLSYPSKSKDKKKISEQEKILNFLDLNNSFIMNMVRKEFERDDFTVARTLRIQEQEKYHEDIQRVSNPGRKEI